MKRVAKSPIYLDNLAALTLKVYAEQAKTAAENRTRARKELFRLEDVSGVALKRAEIRFWELEERQALAKMQQLIECNVPNLHNE